MAVSRHPQRAGTRRSRRRAYIGSYTGSNKYKAGRRHLNVGRYKGVLQRRGKRKG